MADDAGVLRAIVDQARIRIGTPLNVKRYRTLRRLAGVMAPIISVSLAVWVWNSASWLDLCDDVRDLGGACIQPSKGLRIGLLVSSVVGSLIGAALVAYLGRFARIGRMWRHSGWVGLAFVTVTAAWLTMYVVARWS